MIEKLRKNRFLFEELVKRDFKKKYKRTVLGIFWSLLSPLLQLFVMYLVFSRLYGNNVDHFVIYMFSAQLVYLYYTDATNGGMQALMGNAAIFSKVNIPKYLFLLSQNVSSLINFGMTLLVYVIFCLVDGVPITFLWIFLLYPISLLILFNIGVGLILSALYVFFRDIEYLYQIFTMMVMYLSAIFYTIDKFPPLGRNLFLLNPIYLFGRYFRKIVLEQSVPSVWFHLLLLADTLVMLGVGAWMYKRYNQRFLYYV